MTKNDPSDTEDRRLWLPARIFIFMAALMLLVLPLIKLDHALLQFAGAALVLILMLHLSARYLDKRPYSNYGLVLTRRSLIHFLMGSLIGFVSVLLIFYLGSWTGVLSIDLQVDSVQWDAMLNFACKMILVSVIEESFFRGYLLTNIRESLFDASSSERRALIGAVLISSVLFGVAHAGNNHASLLSVSMLAVNGAVWCMPFLITGNLGLSIGLHFAWNLSQHAFGFTLSGNASDNGIYSVENMGHALITGGDFGPEAGLLGLIGFGLMYGLTFLYLKAR